MTDYLETTIGPSAVERVLEIFGQFSERDHAEIAQARKATTEHIFGQVAVGETDEGRFGRLGSHPPEMVGENGGDVAMKIRSHSESHIVELEDGSRWQVFPGDLDLTLDWRPETDLKPERGDDEVASHILVGGEKRVRAIPEGESSPVRQVKSVLKEG